MKKIFPLLLLFTCISLPQIQNELHSPENIKRFADYLFEDKDYLRSATEYERIVEILPHDTIRFKIALAYQQIGEYETALEKFSGTGKESVLYRESQYEIYKILFQTGKYKDLQIKLAGKDEKEFQRLLYLSYLFSEDRIPDQKAFIKNFPSDEEKAILDFYYRKKDPPYKSDLVAGVMSAFIPGSGKIYAGRTGDGITSFIAVSLLAFLTYDNFNHNHNFRGWLFAGIGSLFYAGNIYGSVAASRIYNAGINNEYNSDLNNYLKEKNYFLPENDFIE